MKKKQHLCKFENCQCLVPPDRDDCWSKALHNCNHPHTDWVKQFDKKFTFNAPKQILPPYFEGRGWSWAWEIKTQREQILTIKSFISRLLELKEKEVVGAIKREIIGIMFKATMQAQVTKGDGTGKGCMDLDDYKELNHDILDFLNKEYKLKK